VRPIRIATRGSALALRQTTLMRERLAALGCDAELEVLRTEGDRSQTAPAAIGVTGIFVKELEEALLARRCDLAVHSLKDLPTRLPEGLVLAAVPEREDPRDAVIVARGRGLAAVPAGGRLGTTSPRRVAQLAVARPDLACVPMRGNVDTRLRKLAEGVVDGLVLAMAGLNRLGRAEEREALAVDLMLPASCQGALGLECREDDAELRAVLHALEHAASRVEVEAERAFVRALGCGCQAPVGVLGRVGTSALTLTAVVASLDGKQLLRGEATGPVSDGARLGQELAASLIARGAAEILAEARRVLPA